MSVPGNGEQTLDSSCPLESASGKIHSSELEGKGNKSKKEREEKEPPQVKRTLSAREKFFSDDSMHEGSKSESKNVDLRTSHIGSPSKVAGLNYGANKKNTSRLPTSGSLIPSKISSTNLSRSRIPQKDHVKTEMPSKTEKYSDLLKRDVNLKPTSRLTTVPRVDKLQEISDMGKRPETSRELPKPIAGKATVSSLPIGTVKTKEQGRLGSSLIPASSGSSLNRLSQSPCNKKSFGESKLKQPSGSLNRFGYMKPAEKSNCLSGGQMKYSKSYKVASDGEKGLDISSVRKKPQNCKMETGSSVTDLVEVKEKIRKLPGEQDCSELTGVHIGDANVETLDVNTIEVKGDLMDDCGKEKEKVDSLGNELQVVSEMCSQNDSTDRQNKLASCTRTCSVSPDENDATKEEGCKSGETVDHDCGRISVLDSTETNSSEMKLNKETNGADRKLGVNIQTGEKCGDAGNTRGTLSDSGCIKGNDIDEKPMLEDPLLDTIENGVNDVHICNLQEEGEKENVVKYKSNNICDFKENELVKEPDVIDFDNEKEVVFEVCNPKKQKDQFCEATKEDSLFFSNQTNQNMTDHGISTREDHKETWNKGVNSKSDILVKKHEERGVTEENFDLYEAKHQQSEIFIPSEIVGMERNENIVLEGEDVLDSKRVIEILYETKHLESESTVGDNSSRMETNINKVPEVEEYHMNDKEEIESNVTSIKEVKQDRKVVKTSWEAHEKNPVWTPEAEDKVTKVKELRNLCKQPVETEKIGFIQGGKRKCEELESLLSNEEPVCQTSINDCVSAGISLNCNPEDESNMKEGDGKTVRRVEEKNDVVSTSTDSPSQVKSNKVSRFIQMFSRNSSTASSAVDGSSGMKRNSSSSCVQECAVSMKNKDERKTESRNQSSVKKIWQPCRSQSLKEKYVSKSAKAKDNIIKEHKQKGEEGNSENCEKEPQNEDEIVVPKGQVAARRSKFEAATQGCRTYFSQCIIMPAKNKKHRKRDSKTEEYCVTEMQPQSSSSELFTQVSKTKISDHPEKPQSIDKQDDFSQGKLSMQRCHDSFDDDFIFHTEDKETGLFSKIDEELGSYLTGVHNEVKKTDSVNGKLCGHNQELISIDNFKCIEEKLNKVSPNENNNENLKIGSDLPVCHLSLKPSHSPYRKTSLMSHEQPDSQDLDWISEGLCSEVLETLEKSSDSLVITDDNQNDPLSGENNKSDSLVDVGQVGSSLESDSDAMKQGIESEDPCQSHLDVEFKFCGGGSKVGALVSRFENNHIND